MKSFKVNQNRNLMNSDIQKKFRFKIHHVSGPGFHTEFKFSIRSIPSNDKYKKIEFTANKNIKLAFSENGDKIAEMVESKFEYLVLIPFENGVQRFVEYLDNQGFDISTDLKIKIIEYVFHPIDSKPIGNELGLELALKYVFMNQLNLEKDNRCIFEELIQ